MKDFFLDLSKKENGKYYFNEDIINTGGGSRSPYDVHIIVIKYKNQQIIIKNEIGTANIGSIFCELPISIKQTDFSIRTRSNFFKLFNNKEKSFIITCKNEKLNKVISTNSSLQNLVYFTSKTQFELMVYAKIKNNKYKINTEYNLIFENREKVIVSLIQFYKDLIDELY